MLVVRLLRRPFSLSIRLCWQLDSLAETTARKVNIDMLDGRLTSLTTSMEQTNEKLDRIINAQYVKFSFISCYVIGLF